MTANALKGDRAHCLAAGMDDYLAKPLHSEKLMRVIDAFCPPAAQDAVSGQASGDGGRADPVALELESLVERCGGSAEIAQKVLTKFRAESVQTLAALVRGLADRNHELAVRSAHSLKGMALTVSAGPLGQAVSEAEIMLRAGDWEAVEHRLEHLRRELDRSLSLMPTAATPTVEKPNGRAALSLQAN